MTNPIGSINGIYASNISRSNLIRSLGQTYGKKNSLAAYNANALQKSQSQYANLMEHKDATDFVLKSYIDKLDKHRN